MQTKCTLARVYAEEFSSNRDLSRLETFFVRTLGVPSCTWEDIVEEIRSCKTRSNKIQNCNTRRHIIWVRVQELYRCLLDMRLIGISARDLK